MATKTSSKKSSAVVLPPDYARPQEPQTAKRKMIWRWVIIGLTVLLVGLFAANKGWIVAAVVNGKPIFSWQLNDTLRARYGQQTLEGLIGEKLINDEAQKSGVTVSASDLEKKQKQVLSSLGTDVSLDDFLKFQGLTKTDFQQQLKIQLTVERLLTKGLTITDDEISGYIATNRATLTATDPALLKEEAREAIISNTVSEKLQAWFTQLRQKAAVMKFL
jgi:hypothetical protein